MLYLQQRGLLLGELLQLFQWLQEQPGPGDHQQALLCSLRQANLSFASLHLFQRPSHRLHVGQDHLQVETEKLVKLWLNCNFYIFVLWITYSDLYTSCLSYKTFNVIRYQTVMLTLKGRYHTYAIRQKSVIVHLCRFLICTLIPPKFEFGRIKNITNYFIWVTDTWKAFEI